MLELFVNCCWYEEKAKEILETNIVCTDSLVAMKEIEGCRWNWFEERRKKI